MRIVYFTIMMLISVSAYGDWESYVVEKPDGSVAIHSYNLSARDSLMETLEDAGLGGLPFHKVTADDLPKTKEDRDYWRKAGRQVAVDKALKQQAEQANQQLEQARQAVLDKLGVTEEEIEILTPIMRRKK